MGAVVLLNIALLILAAALWARQARRRAELTEQLAIENEELERRVRRRTAELSALSSHLQQLSEKEKAALGARAARRARRPADRREDGRVLAAEALAESQRSRHPVALGTRILKVLDDGVDFKRRIVENLRPTLLDNMGLLPAVRWITQETCARAGLHYTEVYPEQEPLLIDDAAIMVVSAGAGIADQYRQACARHARCMSRLPCRTTELVILIEDNGVGIDHRPTRRGRLAWSGDHASSRAELRRHLDIELAAAGRNAGTCAPPAGSDRAGSFHPQRFRLPTSAA